MNRMNFSSALRSFPRYKTRPVLLIIVLLLAAATAGAQASPRVEIFITSWCPYCQMLEKTLDSNGIAFTKYDIEKNQKGKRIHQELGGGGVPVTRIDGKKVVRGYDPVAIEDALRQKPSHGGPSI